MSPTRILILAAVTLFSTLAGYALLSPNHPTGPSNTPITTKAPTAPPVETTTTPTVQHPTSQPLLARARLKPVVASSPAPRVITEVQYVDVPAPARPVHRQAREREHEQYESEDRDGD